MTWKAKVRRFQIIATTFQITSEDMLLLRVACYSYVKVLKKYDFNRHNTDKQDLIGYS